MKSSSRSQRSLPPTVDGGLKSEEVEGIEPGSMDELIRKLHPIYTTHIQPLEEMYKFDVFRPSWFEETILNERPFVTLFGPWSSGKSSFINYLLQDNYLWTGPQPTTAEFTVVMYGKEAGPIDGTALANSKDLPFKGLLEFGESFVNNLKGFQVPHPLLERVTLIDTPGVLESAKEVHQRKYNYPKVCRWFAERSDLVFVLFDPTKLEAGVELRQLFTTSFKGLEGKVRIVLNKADTVTTQELMRVYGGLFWNLSNIINTTEPPRVYVGSFWDQPYNPGTFTRLFSEEKVDLLHELLEVIPQQAKDKKVASLIRRAKEVLVHALIIGGIRSDLPKVFGKSKAKRKAMEDLQNRYEMIAAQYRMNHRDFPPVEAYRAFLERFDVEKFPELQKAQKAKLIENIQTCISTTLPSMLRPVKNTRAANPTDTDGQAALLAQYRDNIRSQQKGKEGIQGSTDVAPSTIRKGMIPDGFSPFSNSAMTPGSSEASESQQQTMNAMMAMMQQMMQQQQQQQVQLSSRGSANNSRAMGSSAAGDTTSGNVPKTVVAPQYNTASAADNSSAENKSDDDVCKPDLGDL